MSPNVSKNDTEPLYEHGGGDFPAAVIRPGELDVEVVSRSETSYTLADELRVTVADKVFSKFANELQGWG